jgi:hypothetical protein
MPGSLISVTRFTFAVDESNRALSMPTAHVLRPTTTMRAFTSCVYRPLVPRRVDGVGVACALLISE